MNNSWKPLHVEFHKEDAQEDIENIENVLKDWDYLEFVDDLAHIVNHTNLSDNQKLKSLIMMIDKQYETLFKGEVDSNE